MPTSYQKLVLAYFEQKKNQHTLSKNLLKPTPAGLREECLYVYAEKRKIESEPILRRFFGPLESGNDFTQRIRKCAADKFKPLAIFLKGGTSTPQDKHIELLAWLIDFPRVSDQTIEPQKNVEEESLVSSKQQFTGQVAVDIMISQNESSRGQSDRQSFITLDKQSSSERWNEKSFLNQPINQSYPGESDTRRYLFKIGRFIVPLKFRWSIASFMAVGMTLFGSYIFFQRNNQCMYWNGVQYQSIACNEKIDGAAIIALDTFKLAHLKRITRNDTITRNALGHVWYVKIKADSAEFYTAAGNYPADNKKKLSPMTNYMLKKYILKRLK
jgi:hypothetical protein